MFNLKTILSSSLLALTMACGTALATPVSYHVDVYTGSFASEGKGILELYFSSPGTASAASAVVTKVTGVDGLADAWGSVDQSVAGKFTFSTPFEAGVWQSVTFGGPLGFNVTLDGPADGDDGARFSVSLVGQGDYLVQDLVTIDLYAGLAPAIKAGDIALVSAIDDAPADVPEPSVLLSMMTGLGLLGYAMRRRVR